jgi:hypothetical protein
MSPNLTYYCDVSVYSVADYGLKDPYSIPEESFYYNVHLLRPVPFVCVCVWGEFVSSDPEAPGSMPGATKFSEE